MTKKRYYFSATHAVAAGNPLQYVLYRADENAVPICIGLTGGEPNPVFVKTDQFRIALNKQNIAAIPAMQAAQQNQNTLVHLGPFAGNLTTIIDRNSTITTNTIQKREIEDDSFIATAILEKVSEIEKKYLTQFPDAQTIDVEFSEDHIQAETRDDDLFNYVFITSDKDIEEEVFRNQVRAIKLVSSASADIEKSINWTYTQKLRNQTDGHRYPKATQIHGMAIKDKFLKNVEQLTKQTTTENQANIINNINETLIQTFSTEPQNLPKNLFSALSSLKSARGKWNKNAKVKPSQTKPPQV